MSIHSEVGVLTVFFLWEGFIMFNPEYMGNGEQEATMIYVNHKIQQWKLQDCDGHTMLKRMPDNKVSRKAIECRLEKKEDWSSLNRLCTRRSEKTKNWCMVPKDRKSCTEIFRLPWLGLSVKLMAMLLLLLLLIHKFATYSFQGSHTGQLDWQYYGIMWLALCTIKSISVEFHNEISYFSIK